MLYFLATILVAGVLTSISFFAEVPAILEKAILLPITLFWYYQITKESRLFQTIYGRLMYLAAAILLIGALAKLEHWWWASYCLLIGTLACGMIYLIRFITKPSKQILDWVKLVFLELTLFAVLAKLEHYSIDYYELARIVLFYLMIFLFAITPNKRQEFQRERFSFEEK